MPVHYYLSTGLPEFDRLLRGLIPGDNVVYQVDDVADYKAFVLPYCKHALREGRKLVYFRFAQHAPLLPEDMEATVYELEPDMGFEPFLEAIHRGIESSERRAFYVFDCLTDLAEAWYSDEMLANFFMLTCPYLYDRGDLAYFALLRRRHSTAATMPIEDTAQVFLDVYRHCEELYLRPKKTQQRYSPTMHMLHVWRNRIFEPVSESYTIAQILSPMSTFSLEGTAREPVDVWRRTLQRAQAVLDGGTEKEREEVSTILLRMLVSRDERVLTLASRYFRLEDLLQIGQRMIGTGLIGGKSVGMLLARAILERTDARWSQRLEVHDSFYVASDVFYTFLVRNGCWWVRRQLKDPDFFLLGAEQVRRRIITGTFPAETEAQFARMLAYFGQSPIIVRSSSLLEDNFGNSFAGKYESVFCANQGSNRQRLEDFKSAVRTIYASTMSEAALAYRKRHNLLDRDEQMGLLVQRVSGSLHGNYFFPHVAGVGFSFNPYVWNEHIDPDAGVMRLVFGLGTRAVDRSDDDYTRIVALNSPERRPEGAQSETRHYVQRKVDVLDLDANQLVTDDFLDVTPHCTRLPLPLFTSPDTEVMRQARAQGKRIQAPLLLTFDRLLRETPFVVEMREMLDTLQAAYEYPVDVEFTANFVNETQYYLDIVQCRPLQVQDMSARIEKPEAVEEDRVLLRTAGPVIGQSRLSSIERIIYVKPEVYGRMSVGERYSVARLIGRLMHLTPQDLTPATLLMGPGRWGTTTPSLGVPVSFSEINTVSALCEIVAMREDLVPDVSLGTHFFSELVEMEILYMALFPNHEGHAVNTALFDASENQLLKLLPDAASYAGVVHVLDLSQDTAGCQLYADTVKQQAMCYLSAQKECVDGGLPE